MQNRVGFQLRRKVFRMMGAEMRVTDDSGQLTAFAEAKRLRLKEAVTVYRDEAKTEPLVRIDARQVIDFGATYDISDAASGAPLGALRRQGLRSNFVQDAWTLYDAHGNEIGSIEEDGALLGVVRRYFDLVSLLVPQRYHVTVDGREIGELHRRRHLFAVRFDVAYDADALERLGRETALSYPIVLSLIEDDKQ